MAVNIEDFLFTVIEKGAHIHFLLFSKGGGHYLPLLNSSTQILFSHFTFTTTKKPTKKSQRQSLLVLFVFKFIHRVVCVVSI